MAYAVFRNKNIEKLEELVNSEFEITRVPVRVEVFSKYKNCYMNVQQKVKLAGGKIQYGWAIIENDLMCEAEHHAVWENSNGEFIDITPKPKKVNNILFIPDDRFIYDGRIIDNVRINITGNNVIDDFIKIAEMQSLIMASGTRTGDNTVRLSPIAHTLNSKYLELGAVAIRHAMQKRGLNHPCLCNSGKAYAACHGMGLAEMIASDKELLPNNLISLLAD